MKFANETFEFLEDVDSGKLYSDFEFEGCHFVGCDFSSTHEINLRSTARNIKLTNCEVTGGYIGPGIFEDLLIDGLRVWNHFQTLGSVFSRVTIKGAVDKLMLTPRFDLLGNFPDAQLEFDKANKQFYERIDWALDISKAHFKDCDIRGIPANLFIRDKTTQVVITREKALIGEWRKLDLSKTYWDTSIQGFLEDGYEDCVLVAPKKSRNFSNLVEGLNRLRDAGVAEVD